MKRLFISLLTLSSSYALAMDSDKGLPTWIELDKDRQDMRQLCASIYTRVRLGLGSENQCLTQAFEKYMNDKMIHFQSTCAQELGYPHDNDFQIPKLIREYKGPESFQKALGDLSKVENIDIVEKRLKLLECT